MPLGVAYGIWSALGVAATAVLSSVLFDEAFTLAMVGGLALIIGGVVLVEVGSRPDRGAGLMEWLYLAVAILVEVVATLALRVAAAGRRTWYVGVVAGYVASFVLLSLRSRRRPRHRRRLRHLDRGRRRAHRAGRADCSSTNR